MTDEVVHKALYFTRAMGKAYLNELVLCWATFGSPSPNEIKRHTAVTMDINESNCPECWKAWTNG